MTIPAPEPGQRVWIEAVTRHTPDGQARFQLLHANADAEWSHWWLPSAVRWHPADVPPQPPVLAWSLPDEPGPEITTLRCQCHGIRWDRTKLASAGGETLWEQEGRTAGMEWAVWRYLLAEHTLNDATSEVKA